jgi:HAD superfamily hydrolase (TIGR01490 family)
MSGPIRIAFFDLDKTLISVNSATLWIRAELEAGRLSRWRALHALSWVLRYHLGVGDMASAIRSSVTTLTGQLEADLAARAVAFHAEQVRPCYRPGGREAIRSHRAAGDRLVLLTSSSNYVSQQVRQDLELDDFVCNRLETDAEGRYTGRAIEPLCFGPGKVELANRYAERLGARLSDATFYTDSHSDLPMLEAVCDPVVVHPDPRLRREARRRGWREVDWGG